MWKKKKTTTENKEFLLSHHWFKFKFIHSICNVLIPFFIEEQQSLYRMQNLAENKDKIIMFDCSNSFSESVTMPVEV